MTTTYGVRPGAVVAARPPAASTGHTAIEAAALPVTGGVSDLLARPPPHPQILVDMLGRCLDEAGLSTGLLYMAEEGGRYRLRAQFGIPAYRQADAEALFGNEPLLRRIAESGRPVALSAPADGDAEGRELLRRLGRSSVLVLPLAGFGGAVGELVLASDDHDLSGPGWIAFARSLSDQLGQSAALERSLQGLAASESRQRVLMEQANDAIFVLDPDGTILEANQRSETLLGLSRDRFVGKHISTFTPGEGQTSDHVTRFQQAAAAGGGRTENVTLRRGDGELVHVDFSMSLSEIDGKRTLLSIGRDVTARRRAETALLEAQERFEHILSSSPAVLYSLRVEGERLAPAWTSSNLERLTGYSQQEVGADWWAERIHPEDRERVLADASEVLRSGEGIREYRFRHGDGSYHWIRDEQVLIRHAEQPDEVIGSWFDITARKEAEFHARESEQQYRLLFDHNPFPMALVDQETLNLLAVNDAAVRDYGYSREEFLGLNLNDLRLPERGVTLRTDYDPVTVGAGEPDHRLAHTSKHRTKDGSEIEVEVTRSPIVFHGRAAWLTLAANVTEKRSLEAQLARSQKMEAIGQLAGGIAHDFNNLLGVISGYSELLIHNAPPDSRERRRSEQIKAAADRAAALTRQLLAFSRRQILQPTVLDLGAVVAEVEKMLRRVISADIEIVTRSAAGLGCVRADAGQIEQVLMNLAVNARDAMPAGGRLLIETANVELDETSLRTKPEMRPGGYVMLTVSDSGHGMDAETIASIFEPFFTTKEEGKGTGLGLATVYGIVRQSGGWIDVYSEPGLGTRFQVYLPRVEDCAAARRRGELGDTPRGTETVLVVEDAEPLRLLVRELLEGAGYRVLHADAPDKALALLQSEDAPIQLVLTDLVMPHMSGQELAAQLAVLKPAAKVVFMSGYSEQAIVGHGALAPGTHFLQKPFTMDALLRTVRRALDS